MAAQEDRVNVAEILVKQGANLDAQTKVYFLLNIMLFYYYYILHFTVIHKLGKLMKLYIVFPEGKMQAKFAQVLS